MNKGKEEIKILVVFSFGSKETEGNKELVNAIKVVHRRGQPVENYYSKRHPLK